MFLFLFFLNLLCDTNKILLSNSFKTPIRKLTLINSDKILMAQSSIPNLEENETFTQFLSRKGSELKNSIVELFEISIENSKKGQPGKKGEIWTILQIGTLLMLLGGNVSFKVFPWLGITFQAFSVISLVTGIATLLIALTYNKTNMSPYAVPATETLVTKGPYEYMRHPLYGGLILSAFGFSFLTGSVERMLFSTLLSFLLDKRADLEEKFLLEKFGETYKEYSMNTSKFIPMLY